MHVLENDKEVFNYLKSQLKTIYKNKDKINLEGIMDDIINGLEGYNIISKSESEIVIKMDKKTNPDELIESIRENIRNKIEICDININFLFKFMVINNNLIIRLKRKID